MKAKLIILILLAQSSIYAQNNLLFNKISQNDSLKIICVTNYLDKTQINKRFSFYCDNKTDVSNVLKTFKVGNKTKEIGENNWVDIFLLKGKEVQSVQIVVYPSRGNINTDVLGSYAYYTFDTTQLLNAHKKYPINYFVKLLIWNKKQEFLDFLSLHKNDSTLLCYQNNTLEHDGIGTIIIRKDDNITDFIKAENYVATILEKITKNENEYLIGFVPRPNKSIFTIEVQTSNEIYDKIKDNLLKVMPWESNKIQVLTYWRN